jgi:hypothetical protein
MSGILIETVVLPQAHFERKGDDGVGMQWIVDNVCTANMTRSKADIVIVGGREKVHAIMIESVSCCYPIVRRRSRVRTVLRLTENLIVYGLMYQSSDDTEALVTTLVATKIPW